MAESLTECLNFLERSQRLDVKVASLQHVLSLTGSAEGREMLGKSEQCITALINLLDDQPTIAKDSLLTLVNLTTSPTACTAIISMKSMLPVVEKLLRYALAKDSENADVACGVLANLTRETTGAEHVMDIMELNSDVSCRKVMEIFCLKDYNKAANFHQLGSLLSNITQTKRGRLLVLSKDGCLFQRLLPFIDFKGSITRRGGVVGAIKNCCFETDSHEWLVGPEVDLVPRLLLPLAGGEEFDDDDNSKLPPDLQYLEPEKERESDPDLRKMLIEALNQLCTRPTCRKHIRDVNAYVILRELHNWESDPHTKLALEQLIQILIGDEPERGMENLDQVDIPADVAQKLEKSRLLELKSALAESGDKE